MPSVFDEAEAKIKSESPNPFDQAEFAASSKGTKAKGPRKGLTGRDTRDPRNPNSPYYRTPGREMLDIAEGGAKIAGYSTLPVALAVDPAGTIAGIAGGAIAQSAGEAGAKALGAGDTTARAAGDIAGLAEGGIAAKFGPRATRALIPEAVRGKLGEYLSGIKERWNAAGPPKPKPAPVNRPPAGWKNFPAAKTVLPEETTPIKSELPSGRRAGPAPQKPEPEPTPKATREPGWKNLPESTTEKPGQPVNPIKANWTPRTPKPKPTGAEAAEQLRDSMADKGKIDPKTGKLTIPAPEDVRAADRAKLQPRTKAPANRTESRVNASSNPDRVSMLGEALKAVGFSPEQAKQLSREDWHAIAQQVGIETPDEATVAEAIKTLK